MRARPAPKASRPESRSPSSSGEKRIKAAGSTVIRRAALLAVEWAIPQLPSVNASVKPTTPMSAIRQWSSRESLAVVIPRQAQGSSITEPIVSRAIARVTGPTSSRTIRETEYPVANTRFETSRTP